MARREPPHREILVISTAIGPEGVFTRMMHGLASQAADVKTIMSDATYLEPIARPPVCG